MDESTPFYSGIICMPLLPKCLSPLCECLIAWHHMRKAVVRHPWSCMCLHLLVDVVTLGEGVGVLDVCLSIVLVCLTYAGVCTQRVYIYSIFIG